MLAGTVQHVADIGMSRALDSEILECGRLEKRVCVTLDADFHALLAVSERWIAVDSPRPHRGLERPRTG